MRNHQENDEKKFNEEEVNGLDLTRTTPPANVIVGDKDEGKNGLEPAASKGRVNRHWGSSFFFLTT